MTTTLCQWLTCIPPLQPSRSIPFKPREEAKNMLITKRTQYLRVLYHWPRTPYPSPNTPAAIKNWRTNPISTDARRMTTTRSRCLTSIPPPHPSPAIPFQPREEAENMLIAKRTQDLHILYLQPPTTIKN